jgi:hypothetical protein
MLSTVQVLGESVEFIYCHCNCGFTRSKYKIRNGKPVKCEPRFYINRHSRTGRKHSPETCRKLSESLKGKFSGENNPNYGKTCSIETKNKIGLANKGRKHTKEHNKKISESCKGINSGEKHHLWKGDNVGKAALHDRIRRKKPKPKFCEICGLVPPRELSNKSRKYLTDLSDWWDLCAKCHKMYDEVYERRDPKTGKFKKTMK